MAHITLNGTALADLGGELIRPSLEVTWSTGSPDSCRFTLAGYRPQDWDEVAVYRDDQTTLVWAGVVLSSESTRVGRGPDREAEWAVACGGFSHLLQRRLATVRYPSQPAGDTIRDLLADYCPELDTTHVEDGQTMGVVAFSGYPLQLVDKLAKAHGWAWRVDETKALWFGPATAQPAPADLTDSSANFADLRVTHDGATIRNAVTLRGGLVPSTSTVTDTWAGDGVTGNFKLSYEPYTLSKNPLLLDRFNPTADYHPDPNLWQETDQTNPSPPAQSDSGKAPFTGTDGYLVVDNFGAQQGACCFVGGTGTWGQVGILANDGCDRAEDRYLFATFVVNATSDWLVGWFDGIGVAATDCLYGVLIESTGQVHTYLSGAKSAVAGPLTYATATTYSVRLTLKAAGGCRIEIQGGTFGTWGGTSWTTLLNTSSGTATVLYPGATIKSGDVNLYEMRAADPVLGVTVEQQLTAGVWTTLVAGLDGLDTAQVDCLINGKGQLLRFFAGSVPAAPPGGQAVNIRATYRRPVPLRVFGTDAASIAALAARTGETGPTAGWREYTLVNRDVVDRREASARVQAELEQYANPVTRAEWTTTVDGYRPGQLVGVQSSPEGVDATFVVSGVTWRAELEDDVDAGTYTVQAGTTLKGPDDYLAELIALGKRVDVDANEPLEWATVGTDTCTITETVDKLTTDPDVAGTDTVTITELVDELALGPPGPYLYDAATAKWGRATYA